MVIETHYIRQAINDKPDLFKEFEADQLIVYAGHVCWTLDVDLLRIPAHWAAAEACVGAKILAISSSIALLSRIRTSAPPGVVQN